MLADVVFARLGANTREQSGELGRRSPRTAGSSRDVSERDMAQGQSLGHGRFGRRDAPHLPQQGRPKPQAARGRGSEGLS
jgi:hypothetical protein